MFQNFSVTFDPLSQVSKFQHHTHTGTNIDYPVASIKMSK